MVAAAGKSEFGVCGVVGGMMVNELLAGTMRRGRGGIVAVEDDMRQTYTVADPIGGVRVVGCIFLCYTIGH